ncbi:hypothetical protein VH441_01015 [Psychrobacter sp. HD31]|uniref:hypothetical protein n=1 Tax=Psychrobacter sp. HD31 TaxID=3112003 RepID=UPI003DA1EC5B
MGLISNILIITTIYLLFIYPLHFNNFFQLNEYQVYISTITCFTFSILILIKTIPQYFSFTELEYKSRIESEVTITDNKAVDYNKENQILKETLIKNGRTELRETREIESFKSIYINMPDNKTEAFFVIHIHFENKDIYNIVESIEKYSYDFFIEVCDINVDVNSFVLSYFITIDNSNKKNYFIRAKTTEIDNLKSRHSNPKDFIKNIDNKVIDELFRNV